MPTEDYIFKSDSVGRWTFQPCRFTPPEPLIFSTETRRGHQFKYCGRVNPAIHSIAERGSRSHCESHACLLLRYVGPRVTQWFQQIHCSADGSNIRHKAYRPEVDQGSEVKTNREMTERAITAFDGLSSILGYSSLPPSSKLNRVHCDH